MGETLVSSRGNVNAEPQLDPDQALMSRLIQDLGLIQILKYNDEHPLKIHIIEKPG